MWDAYEEHERIANYRTGLVASLLYNQNRRKGSQPITPLDWFGGKKDKPVQSADEIKSQLETWAAVVNRKK